jgi:hypothetical protein
MRTAATRLLIAAVLLVAGAAAWSEAALARRVADAHVRLATLHYDEADRIDEGTTALNRLPLPIVSLSDEIRRHRSRVAYWRARDLPPDSAPAAVTPLPGARGGNVAETGEAADPDVMLIATNTAFRAAARQTADRIRAVERLDTVIQAYGEVLRADPGNADASYNYEYAVRVRDGIARGRAPARGRGATEPEPMPAVDLPAGPTIHGYPGGPPPEIPGDQFRTIAPMPYEEREESDPGRGPTPRRRG